MTGSVTFGADRGDVVAVAELEPDRRDAGLQAVDVCRSLAEGAAAPAPRSAPPKRVKRMLVAEVEAGDLVDSRRRRR